MYLRVRVGDKQIDTRTRERIRAWVIHLRDTEFHGNAAAMARVLGFKQSSHVTQIASGARTAGFDFVLRMHRELGKTMDQLVDRFPTAKAETEAIIKVPPDPTSASVGHAAQRRRKQQGG